jgi:hypothetical protein
MPSQQNVTIRAKGLYSFPNSLSAVPDGALTEASNVVIDRDEVIEPRRGFNFYGNSFGSASTKSKQLMTYRERIFRHYTTNIEVDSNGQGAFTLMDDETGGVASVTEPSTGIRIKYVEQNGNLYFTSSLGVRKISCLDPDTIASKQITLAGGVKALDGQATLNPTPGWFLSDSVVAYRIVWGIKDENTNVILGAPSERIVIENSGLNLLIKDFNTLVSNLSIVAEVTPQVLTGDITIASPIVTNTNTTTLSVGQTVSGVDIPANTYILSITNPTTLVLTNNATATVVAESLTFGQRLTSTDYNTLIISNNSSAAQLYAALAALANGPTNKLDSDLLFQTAQVVSINAIAGNLYQNTDSSDYFDISNAYNTIKYRVWFQVQTTVAPSTNGVTLLPISVAITDTDAQVASKINAALNSTGDFTSTVLLNVLTVTNNDVGVSASPYVNVVDPTFTATTTTAGVSPEFGNIPITPTTTPHNPPTAGEITQMQAYYDEIVNQLNITPGISDVARQSIGGSFANSTGSATVNLIFTVPDAITTEYFYQIYRSALFQAGPNSTLADVVPDDELRLIFEGNPTDQDLLNHFVNFYDNIPEAFREGGANLYTNANSGEGILQANTPPPLALDISTFKNCTFYANTQTRYSKQFGLLTAVGLAGGKITIASDVSTNTYTFVDSTQQIVDVTLVAGNLYTSSGTSDYFDIFNANDIINYRVWFQAGTSVAPSGTGVELVECTVLNTDTADQVAIKIQVLLSQTNSFSCTTVSNVVTVTNEDSGGASSPTDNVADAGFSIAITTPGTGENEATLSIGVSSAATPSQQVDETARSIIRIINKNINETVYAYYISGPTDLPGLILLENRNIGDGVFYISANTTAISQKFNPDLKTVSPITSISIANPTVITSALHGLVSGDKIIISGSDSTPSVDGLQVATVINANTFSVPVNVTVAGTVGGFVNTKVAIAGDNEAIPNRLYYSKPQQPEAVPIVNYQDIGHKNKRIVRILPLRDSLFILTEDAIYRLSGDTPNNFSITLFDSSTVIKASDSAVVLNNQIYMFSSQGIATVSDTGVQIISRPIENKLVPLTTSTYTNFPTATFAVPYESDRAYILFTTKNTSDVTSTVCYRYNTFTNTWVSWDVQKTCGVVNPREDILYLGPSDVNYTERERKSFTRLDHADRQYTLNVPVDGISGNILSLGSLFNTVDGDVFVQTQYLTIAQFNRLLKHIDSDTGLNQKNYYSSLEALPGVNLRQKVTDLATKLDSDSGLAIHGYVATISGFTNSFPDTQAAFNVIVNRLIADPNTFIKTYSESTGVVEYEVSVVGVDAQTLKITLLYAAPIISGDIEQYKKFNTSVVWNNHHFADPSLLKQVSESTVIFDNVAFSKAFISFSSDLSTGLEGMSMPGEGTGIWGGFDWGQSTWGGQGTNRPFRTYVPVNKQRCRYIVSKFQHSNALEDFAIFGISYTYSMISSRAYR